VLAESLALTAALFIIGVVGVLIHRNAIIIFMCVELMLTAVNLTFVAFSRFYGTAGQGFVVFVMKGGIVYKNVSTPRGLPARGPRPARGATPKPTPTPEEAGFGDHRSGGE